MKKKKKRELRKKEKDKEKKKVNPPSRPCHLESTFAHEEARAHHVFRKRIFILEIFFSL